MAINNNDFQKYKNRVAGAVQQDLYSDINFQNAEIFKQNIRNQQGQQGLSYNSYQNDIRRQLNNAANGILQQSQNGLIGSSALRQMITNQQQAGQSIAQTANSYAQSQQQANMQLNQANVEEQNLEKQYTQQEANKAYQSDLQAGVDAENRSSRIASGIFGGLGALGAVLSFIPFTAPVGLALDAISAAGMVGTDIYQEANNPTAGNATQLGVDSLFAGLSLIPGVSAVRGLTAESRTIEKGIKAETATMNSPAYWNLGAESVNRAVKIEGETATTYYSGLVADSTNNPANFYKNFGNKIAMNKPITTNELALLSKDLNATKTIESLDNKVLQIGLDKKTTNEIKTEVKQELAQEGKSEEKNKIAYLTKYKNKLWEAIQGKSTWERTQLAKARFGKATNGLIGSQRILRGARSITGTVARGAVRGVFLGGTHYVTNSILNKYLDNEDPAINATQLTWRQIFDRLNIPENLRPQGL